MNEYGMYRSYGRRRIPQKKNPYNKVEGWRKPWIAKHHVYDGVQVFR